MTNDEYEENRLSCYKLDSVIQDFKRKRTLKHFPKFCRQVNGVIQRVFSLLFCCFLYFCTTCINAEIPKRHSNRKSKKPCSIPKVEVEDKTIFIFCIIDKAHFEFMKFNDSFFSSFSSFSLILVQSIVQRKKKEKRKQNSSNSNNEKFTSIAKLSIVIKQ